jgi:FKBP-type peptidyl-prolyl cis-trans isomerase
MTKFFICLLMAAAMISNPLMAKKKKAKPEELVLKTEKDSASYALGAEIGANLKRDGLDSTLTAEWLQKGLLDGLTGKALLNNTERMTIIQGFFEKEMEKQTAKFKDKSDKFLADNSQKPGVKVTKSGLQYEVLKEGEGPKPTAESTVVVHYTGFLTDGQIFDSTGDGEPVEFPLDRVIPGWTEGIQLMSVGSKFKFYIPSDLAYGAQGQPQANIKPYDVLIFEVELLGIK